MPNNRVEYLLLLDGLEAASLWSAIRAALSLVADDTFRAETDIPWDLRDSWPPEAAGAAARLRDRFVPEHKRVEGYMQTGVQSTAELGVLADFISVAPHAYDATSWRSDSAAVASLSDEGMSFAIWLTDEGRETLAELIGAGRIVTLAEWRWAHPPFWRSLLSRLKRTGD